MKRFLFKFVEASSSRKGRWVTLIIWVLIVGALSSMFPNVQKVTNNGAANLPNHKMSVQAEKVIKKQFPNETGIPLLLVWYRDGGLEQKDYGLIADLYNQLDKAPLSAQNFIPPLGKLPPQALTSSASEDGTSIVTPIFMKKDATTDELKADLNVLKKQLIELDSPSIYNKKLSENGLHIRFTGPVGISTDASALFGQADVTLLIATILLVLVLLIILYRSPILAIVPIIGVGFAYGATSPILGLLAEKGTIVVDSQAVSIMTVLLFGAGTDYCLFLVSKYRECLLEEENKYKALQQAIRHSGGAILVSAITVVLSLCTLLLAQFGSYHRFAVPFSLAILIMGIAALTLLPALLSIFGRVSFYPFIPRTEEMIRKIERQKGKNIRRSKPHSKFSENLGKWVTRKPWTVILLSVIILGILASFAPRIQYTQNLLESFPKDMASREGFDLMKEHFSPGELAPVRIIINTEGKNVELLDRLSELSIVDTISEPTKGKENKEILAFDVNLNTNPYDTKAVEAIPMIEKQIALALKDAKITPDKHYWIGGETSSLYDTEATTARDMKVIVPVVVVIIAALLLMYLRSIVAMVYLILTVLFSYVSALGAGWLLIHYGMGIPAIQGLIPLYAFVFLVALGEDYNIFMISSIWKNRKNQSHHKAIAKGVSETSSVITSAGLILAGTFAVLATLPIQVLLQFGIITAIGVLLDTFVVRPLLVPAITTVLGRFAFWPGKLWRKREKASSEFNE
ncbi:membrane protein [Heyndrickxia sporothermodurans]|nr:membrane protein [Heyndrickxia sporothermodurans]